MIGLVVLLLFASVGSAVYMVLAQRLDRVSVQGALREIEHVEGDPATVRDSELAQPLAQRVLVPLTGGLLNLIRRFTPADYTAKIRQDLVMAGQVDPEEVDRFMVKRLLALLILPFSFIFVFKVAHLGGIKALAMVGLCGLVAVLGPTATLNRKIADRRKAIQKTLADVLDLLSISVEAGLGFEQALDRAVDAVPGPLSEELGRMLGEMRAGARRSDALRNFDSRIGLFDIHSFTLAILQADSFGVSITRVLRSQADEMRVRRRQAAQEKAMKAPVKMLVPMVFCIFPSLFVVVLGPAMLNIITGLK
jgi:tight adherence protein C